MYLFNVIFVLLEDQGLPEEVLLKKANKETKLFPPFKSVLLPCNYMSLTCKNGQESKPPSYNTSQKITDLLQTIFGGEGGGECFRTPKFQVPCIEEGGDLINHSHTANSNLITTSPWVCN